MSLATDQGLPGDAPSRLVGVTTGVAGLLTLLSEGEIPFVIVGGVARAVHGESVSVDSADLVADLSTRHARALSQVLNRVSARPRGVLSREGFAFDSALLRSVPCLALKINDVSLNISRTLAGVGEFPQVSEASVLVTLDGFSTRVLSQDGLSRAAAALPRLAGSA